MVPLDKEILPKKTVQFQLEQTPTTPVSKKEQDEESQNSKAVALIQAELAASAKKSQPNNNQSFKASPIPSIQGRMNKSNTDEQEIGNLIPSTTPQP